MKKIKIAIYHCGFIYSGGGERIVLEEALGLKSRGYDVSVWAPTVDYKKCYPQMLRELNVKAFLPSIIDKLPYRNALRMVVTSFLAPVIALGFQDTDIFIGANQPGAWIAFCVAKVLNKPYIVYLNQPNRVIHPRPVDVKYGWYSTVKDFHILYKIFGFLSPLLAVLDKASIVHADRVLVNGGYIGDVIQNIYSVRTLNAPAGATPAAKKDLNLSRKSLFTGSLRISKSRIKKPYALITNRHDPQKRFDFVIKALALVNKKRKPVSLAIPGPFTEHTKHLVKLAKKLGIEQKVYFLGQISEQELKKLYRSAAVYCYPSPQEDFGLGPIEAGAWAVPTVAWNHAGPTVTVKDGESGFLAKPYKVKDYAAKMLKILNDPGLRIKMGKLSYLRTENLFSWDRHLTILEKSLLKVISKRKRA